MKDLTTQYMCDDGSMTTITRIAVQRGLFISGLALFLFQSALVSMGKEPFKSAHFLLPLLICLSSYYELRQSRQAKIPPTP